MLKHHLLCEQLPYTCMLLTNTHVGSGAQVRVRWKFDHPFPRLLLLTDEI